jgi:hypothetical protein
LPSRALSAGGCLAGAGLEAGEDGVADLALEAPERFLVRLSLGQLLVVIGPAVAVPVPDLSNGGHVDGVVDAPAAAQDSRWIFRFPDDTSTGAVPL